MTVTTNTGTLTSSVGAFPLLNREVNHSSFLLDWNPDEHPVSGNKLAAHMFLGAVVFPFKTRRHNCPPTLWASKSVYGEVE